MSYNLDAVPILPPIQSSDYFNPQPEWKKSIASHLDELQAMGGGALGMAGTALGIEGLQKAGQEIYNRNMEESQAGWQRPAVPRVEDVRFSEPGGAGRVLDFAMYQGPKALASIGESLLGGLGGGAIVKGLAKRGLSETAGDAAKQVLERQWMKGAAAGSLGTNAAMESSQAFGQMVQDGATPEDSLVPALAYGAASSATEAVPGYLMAKHMGWLEPFKDKVRKEILGDAALSGAAVKLAQGKLGQFTKGVVAGGAAEGLQEGTQQLLQIAAERVAKGDPMFADLSDEDKSQVLNSAVVGMLGGGLVGGPVGLMGGHGSTTQPKEQGSRALTPSVIAGSQAPEAEPVEEKKQWNYGPHNGSDPRGFDPNWKFNTGPSGIGVYGEAPLEGEVIDGQRREPQRRLPWPAIEGEVVPDPTQIGEVPLTGDVVNGPERQKQRTLPWPPLEGEVVDQQAIEQQRKPTGPRQLGAPSIVPQLARTTETPHLEEDIDPSEWDQAFGQREVPPNEADFWNQVGKQEEANQQIHDRLDPAEWDQAFGTELVPENEVDFWRRMGEDLPGPVVRADGKPYVTQKSAEAAARRNVVDGQVVQIKGGFAVQPWTVPPVRPLSDKAQLNPTEPLGRIEQDPRLQDPEVRARMLQLADQTGWEQEGGRIIRDASGKVVNRTKWLPKRDWWIDRPRDVKPHHVKAGMAKIEKGEPLQTRERRAVAWLATMASADLHEENPAKWNLGEPTNAQQEPSTSTPDGSRSAQPNVRQEGGDLTEGRQGVQPGGQGRQPEVASPDWGRAASVANEIPTAPRTTAIVVSPQRAKAQALGFDVGDTLIFGGREAPPPGLDGVRPGTTLAVVAVQANDVVQLATPANGVKRVALRDLESTASNWVALPGRTFEAEINAEGQYTVPGAVALEMEQLGEVPNEEELKRVPGVVEVAQNIRAESPDFRTFSAKIAAAFGHLGEKARQWARVLWKATGKALVAAFIFVQPNVHIPQVVLDRFAELPTAVIQAIHATVGPQASQRVVMEAQKPAQIVPNELSESELSSAEENLRMYVEDLRDDAQNMRVPASSRVDGSEQWKARADASIEKANKGEKLSPTEMLFTLYGQAEGQNKVLQQMLASFGIKEGQTTFPWCTAAISYVHNRVGALNKGKPFNVLNARGYLKVGKGVQLNQAKEGDVLVLRNGNPKTGGWEGFGGHTAFFLKQQGDIIWGLGGNQNDEVNVMMFHKDQVLGVRRTVDPEVKLAGTEPNPFEGGSEFKFGKDQRRTESPVQNPTTRERLESILQDLTGRTSHWRVHIHESAPQGADSSTYGWVQKENGKYHVHFILDRIEQGTELSKFLHEVGGHLGIDGLLAPGERKRLVDAIRRWTSADGMEGDIARAAQRRVEAAGTPVADQDSELIAYFLEEAVQRGVTPTAKGGLGDWFRTLWAAFKRGLRKLGLRNVDQLTLQHVVDLAYGAAKLELAGRVPEGDMGSEGIRYGKLYTAPTVGPDANLNPPSYVNKILYDYTNGLADLKKLHPKLESLINRVASKRGSVLEHYHYDKVKPFTDKMADYKNLTGKSDEEVNLEFAARHVAADQENHLMALREAKHTAIEFEKVLRGIWRGMDPANPMRAELGTLIREFTKGRANLMKGWPWGWVVTAQMRRNRNIQPVNHLTNRQVQEKLVEKLESLLNTQLSNGNELWANFDNIKDMRMEWEALRNHGAGLQTKGTMSQRPSVRTAFEQWMGPQRMAELARLDADTIWTRAQSQQHSAEFLDLARRLDEVAADIRDQRVRGRLSTPGEATAMATDHPHWVPLRRESYDFEDVFGGTGASNRRMKARFGTPKIDPPVHVYQNAFAALDLTVTAAEANLARIELADTLRADPSLLEGWFEESTSLPESQKRYDKQGFAQYTWKPHEQYSIPFLVDGDPWVIPIVKSNERAQVVSAAIQNLAPMDQRAVMTLFKNANKFLRWVIISANPAFTLTNAPKDFGHAMMTIQAGPLAKYSKEIAASYKDCFMELWRHFVLKQPSQTILDMEKAGGRITFVESLRPNDRGFGSVEKSVAWAQGGKVLRPEMARGLRDFLHMIEDVNIAVESVMRLAVWKAGKRHQAALGVTDDELGSLCKDVTVNYDRRGLRSHIVNAFYMFFNASVQGVSGVLDAAYNGPNRARFLKAIGGVMTAALLADLVGAALSPGWDDTPEDQKDRFARIPGSDLVLPGDTMAKVPLPWVFNVVWRAGEMLGEMVRGQLSPARYVAKLLELTINSTNPIGGSVQVAGAEGSGKDFDFGAPSVMTMLTPSALDWFTQIQTNRDPFGRPMGPEKLPSEKYKPESEMSWDSTPKFYKWVARELNSWTGGSQGESGLLDWRPSTYKTLVDTLGGGLGQVMTGLAGTAWGVAAGNPPSINRVPGAKSFFFTPSGQVGSGLYHERVARVEQARAGTKALEGLGPEGRPDLEALRASKSIELRMAPALDDTERQITDLRKQMKEAMKRGQDSRVETLKGRIKLAQERFNRVWERRSSN